jgi:hypothetical protein
MPEPLDPYETDDPDEAFRRHCIMYRELYIREAEEKNEQL